MSTWDDDPGRDPVRLEGPWVWTDRRGKRVIHHLWVDDDDRKPTKGIRGAIAALVRFLLEMDQ